MAKQILMGQEANNKIIIGVNKLADAVGITLGPKGKNVLLDKGFGAPSSTKDGVTIAKEIELGDKTENMGAELVKEAASKTNENAGDGTTTAVVLAQAMMNFGVNMINSRPPSLGGINIQQVQEGMREAVNKVVNYLQEEAVQVRGDMKKIQQVATISVNNDEEIGKIIGEAINKVGNDGVITVEESQTFGISQEVVEGMQFDKGYVSPYMVTNAERMEAEYKDAHILITDKKVSALSEILPLLEKLAQSGTKELVIIADEVEGEALTTFVINKLRGTFNVLAVKAPGFGDRRKEMLHDIAALTGGRVISEDVGLKLENATPEMLGQARRVVATKEITTIVAGKGNQKEINDRIAQIKKEIKDSTSDFDKEKLRERLARLSGGVAVLKVGAATEIEMKEKKQRIEDAVAATKAAIEEGIVAGGGTALIAAKLKVLTGDLGISSAAPISDKLLGYQIIGSALEAPLIKIASNAGKHGPQVFVNVVSMMLENKSNQFEVKDPKDVKNVYAGYDAKKDKLVENMITEGIIDPLKVTKSALENAASVASMLLSSSVVITDLPEKKEPMGMPGGMPGMGGMGGMDMGM